MKTKAAPERNGHPPAATPPGDTQLLPVHNIGYSPTNPRRTIETDTLGELAESIKTKGVLQPILVRPAQRPGPNGLEQLDLGPKSSKQFANLLDPYRITTVEQLLERVDQGGGARGAALQSMGIRQPMLDEVVEAIYAWENAWKDKLGYQLVAGERRLRAAKMAGLREIPARVGNWTDREVLEIQVIENEQREDVPAVEKADGYARLIDQHGVSVEDLAARVGKSPSTIRGLLKLRRLPELARKALGTGQLSASTAQLIGRIPDPAAREEMTRRVLANQSYGGEVPDVKRIQAYLDEGGETLNYREAKAVIERFYMIELKTAPFSRKSLDLVPAAGSCDECPKRTGNSPEEYPDSRADVCTDPSCYRAKVQAHQAQLLKAAEESGKKILPKKECKDLFRTYDPHQLEYNAPFVDLAGTCHDLPGNKGWKKLVGKQLADQVVVAVDPDGGVHELVPKHAALKVLRDEHGAVKAKNTSDTKYAAEQKKREAEERKKQQIRKTAALKAGETIAAVTHERMAAIEFTGAATEILRALAMFLPEVIWSDACRLVRQRRDLVKGDDRAVIRAAANNLATAPELMALITEMVGARLLQQFTGTYHTGQVGPEDREFLKAFGVDLPTLCKEIGQQAKAKKPSKTPSALVSKSVTVGVCRVCGCTEQDCANCIERTGEPCTWVEPDLCSACQGKTAEQVQAEIEALNLPPDDRESFATAGDTCCRCTRVGGEVVDDPNLMDQDDDICPLDNLDMGITDALGLTAEEADGKVLCAECLGKIIKDQTADEQPKKARRKKVNS